MRAWLASVVDGAAVLLFAAVGRLSHAEGVTPVGVLDVAWPFLVGGPSAPWPAAPGDARRR